MLRLQGRAHASHQGGQGCVTSSWRMRSVSMVAGSLHAGEDLQVL